MNRFGVVGAVSKNGVIGVGGKLPWDLPSERQHFKNLTRGKILIIGRKTFEEEPDLCHISHAQRCIIVSGSLEEDSLKQSPMLSLAKTLPDALNHARIALEKSHSTTKENRDHIECWVAGGERLYNDALVHPNCVEVQITEVDTEIAMVRGDLPVTGIARFPPKYRWDNKFVLDSAIDGPPESDPEYTTYVYTRVMAR